jgi:hypothetical protein
MQGEKEVSFEAETGSQLEALYNEKGIRPTVTRIISIADVQQELSSNRAPVLLHIVAAVREVAGAIYLDFSSTLHRIRTFEPDSVGLETSMTTTHLSNLLSGLKPPPFVVLDISRPYSPTEAVRMLLLRNRFATDLFELGNTRGILGCGLAAPRDRLAISSSIIEQLLYDTVSSGLGQLRSEPMDDLEQILSRRAAALWTNDPDDRLFI